MFSLGYHQYSVELRTDHIRVFREYGCSGCAGLRGVRMFRECGCSGSTGVQGVRVFRVCGCSGCASVQGANPEEDDLGHFCFFHVSFYKHLSFHSNMLLYPFIQFSTTETITSSNSCAFILRTDSEGVRGRNLAEISSQEKGRFSLCPKSPRIRRQIPNLNLNPWLRGHCCFHLHHAAS